MNTCPLCKSKVLYAGLNDLECSGRGCQNYKALPGDEPITSHFILSFFGRVYKITGKDWYPKVPDVNAYWAALGCSLIEIHGATPDPIVVDVGRSAISVKAFGDWVRENHPAWAGCL